MRSLPMLGCLVWLFLWLWWRDTPKITDFQRELDHARQEASRR